MYILYIAGARLSLADGLPSVAPTVSLFDAVVVVTARARVCRLTSLFAIQKIAVAVVLLRRPCACVGLRWLFYCEGGCRCGLRLSGPAAARFLGRRRVLPVGCEKIGVCGKKDNPHQN